MSLRTSVPACRILAALPLLWAILVLAAPTQAVVTLSEIRIDHTGNDLNEYFELAGTPNEPLTGITYVVLGDAGSVGTCGVIEAAIDLGAFSIQPDGFFAANIISTFGPPTLAGFDAAVAGAFENSDNVTHMIVTGFTGAVLDDLDTNDDGVLDTTPWTAIVDCVGLDEGTIPDCTGNEYLYCATTVGPDGANVPAHVYNCGGTWVIGAFDVALSNDTPGAANDCGNQEPMVTNLLHRPFVVNPAEAATVQADVTDSDGTISSVTLFYRLNGGGFSSTAMALGTAPTYAGNIPGQALGTVVDYYVEAQDDLGATTVSPAGAPAVTNSYTVANDVITSIAAIHADLVTYTGTQVQIEAQVYCPGDYRGPGNPTSAYVQDGSNRGLNIFGDLGSFGQTLLNDVSNIVRVTGTVSVFGTTVELTQYEVELISTGNPPLSPAIQVSTAAAAASSNEGTFIESSGVITAISVALGAYDFTIDDGSGPVVVRVDEDLRPDLGTAFAVNDEIFGRGAGSTFNGQGQILVCDGSHVGLTGNDPAPLLQSAVLTAANQVTLTFNESIDPISGNVAANYEVFETAAPGNSIGISAAAVQVPDTQVLLTLAVNVPANVPHTVRVNDVEDLAGNPIAPNTEAPILDPNLGVGALQITEIMQNPSCVTDDLGEWFELRNIGATAVDIDGFELRDNGIDSHVIDNGGPLTVGPGAYVVLARDRTTAEGQGVVVHYEYSDFVLANGDDEVLVVNPAGTIVDQVDYTGVAPWPSPNGTSMQWNESGDNNDGTNWATGGHVFGCGDTGTPGTAFDPSTSAPALQPAVTKVYANVPNPFNPTTTLRFSLSQQERARLAVFNVRGQLVRIIADEVLAAGLHAGFVWDGRDDAGAPAPSGIYFFQLSTASGYVESRKLALLK